MPTIEERAAIQLELDRQTVSRALRNAIIAGHVEVTTLPPSVVAINLYIYDSDLKDYDINEIEQHIHYCQKNDRLIKLCAQVSK